MSKTYKVKECFLTLQGEGEFAGRAAVFVRFSGCNLWSGREEDRGEGVGDCSKWCDTDFRGGTRYSLSALVAEVVRLWGTRAQHRRYVVLTGGEPGLQVDDALIGALREAGFFIGIETNGTCPLPDGIDHITVSPKGGLPLKVTTAHVLKLVYPQPDQTPAVWVALQRQGSVHFAHRFLQPLDGPDRESNTRLCVEYCLAHPEWALSLQTHKLLGIP